MKINTFDKGNLQAIRKDLAAALAAVESKYGVKIGLDNFRFTDNSFHTKMTVAVENESTESGADPKWIADFYRNYFSFGLKKEDLGREFMMNGKKARLVGSRSRANQPLVIQYAGEKEFKIAAIDRVVNCLKVK